MYQNTIDRLLNQTPLRMPTLFKYLLVVLFSISSLQLSAQDELASFTSRDEATADATYQKGQTIWKGNCASCHKVGAKLIGPALAGVYDKYEREWLYKWIKNSQALIKTGDERANAIYAEYNQSVMTAFPMLSNADIDAVLVYVKAETEFPPAAAVLATPVGGSEEVATSFDWTSPQNIFLTVLTVALLAIALVLGRLLTSMSNVVREKEGLPALQPVSIGSIFNSRPFRVAATLLLLGFLSYTTYDNGLMLGYQQGYKPDQPIKFSHKLHAGKWAIECQYCHSGAYHGKSAVIPSTNICMNCHKLIKEGPEYGTKEIAKIYDAVGWDADKAKYKEGYEQKNVEWVRIHNLPDHVYFNHAQHVNAGQVECQTCHGEIEKMEVVEQHSSLGMGWCIDCHRETAVKFTGNDYYLHHYEKLHKAIKDGDVSTVTVEDLGGTECQKCHY